MKQFIFWASYLYFPFILGCLLGIVRQRGPLRLAALIAIAASSVFGYARFVEPNILTVKHSDIILSGADASGTKLRLALFSDTHFGIFKNAMPMQRIVNRINEESPDAVLIAGDFLYHLETDEIAKTLAPLSDLTVPIFAVLGNHDVGFPGPVYTPNLYTALTELGVVLVENRAHAVVLAERNVIIAGASDLWQRRQDFSFSAKLPDVPLFLLTHNPDTALNVPKDLQYDLMLAGHTHGGQVRLPGLVNRVIPTEHPFDKGLHTFETGNESKLVYITPGTGMVGLPLRFNMPPRIDILTVTLPPPS